MAKVVHSKRIDWHKSSNKGTNLVHFGIKERLYTNNPAYRPAPHHIMPDNIYT